MFMLLIVVILALGLYHYLTHYSRTGKLLNKLPGPAIIPFLGNIHMFMVPPIELWNVSRMLNQKYYPLNRVWITHVSGVNIVHPDDAETLLSSMKHIEKSRIYNFLHPWLESGLLTSTGNKWQTRRKMLTPAFHFSILHQFIDIFNEQGTSLVQYLKSQGNETVKDIVPLFTKYTLSTICETAMGTSLDDAAIQEEYRTAVRKVGDSIVYRVCRPWLYADWAFKLFPSGISQTKYLSTLHNFSSKIIKERKMYHEETGGQYLKSITSGEERSILSGEEIKGNKKRMALLDHLIAAQRNGEKIDDNGIREEVDTFIFEGHDTTAMAMTFTLLMFAEHKDIQERARKEVDEVMDGRNGKIVAVELQRLNYLEQCIKETLRLYPSVPFISRVVREDLQLKNYLIPGGTSVHLHIYDLHRNPNFWPDPEKFDPNRFLPEKMQIRHPFSYIPFSGGPRNCIGQKFAMLELKAFMAHLLYNFNFEHIDHSSEINFLCDLVIRPAVKIRVKFETRLK